VTGDHLAQLLERLRRTILHLEVGTVIFLVGRPRPARYQHRDKDLLTAVNPS
jgi:hypothetical protein